jgi:hypothetical protein
MEKKDIKEIVVLTCFTLWFWSKKISMVCQGPNFELTKQDYLFASTKLN